MSEENDNNEDKKVETFTLEQVQEMSYVSAIHATTLYGTGYSSGAIRVTSRRRR
jgi:hypothetical protein